MRKNQGFARTELKYGKEKCILLTDAVAISFLFLQNAINPYWLSDPKLNMNQQPQRSRIINWGTKASINIPPYDGPAKSEINATTGDCCTRCTATEWLGLACLLYINSTLFGGYGLVHSKVASEHQRKY